MLAVFAVGYLAVPLSFANGNVQREPGFYLALVLAFTAFMLVGVVIVAHRPGNAVGWIFSAIGLLSAAGVLTMEYAEFAYVTRPGRCPGPPWPPGSRGGGCRSSASSSCSPCCCSPPATCRRPAGGRSR
jgi:hypothetical protein